MTYCPLSWWQCSLLNYTQFAGCPGMDPLPCLWQAAALIYCCLDTQNHWPGENPMSWSQLCWVNPMQVSSQLRLSCREAMRHMGAIGFSSYKGLLESVLCLSEVCDKYLVAPWWFGVKRFGIQHLIVLGLWWVTCTFLPYSVCSFKIKVKSKAILISTYLQASWAVFSAFSFSWEPPRSIPICEFLPRSSSCLV